jgi:tetratricopeptide (TPR) repeat protein
MSTANPSKEFLNNKAENTPTIREKIECYQKIIELDFDDPGAFFNLGNIYSEFDENKSKKYWEMSVHRYAKKIESFKEDASTYLKQSRKTESLKTEVKDACTHLKQSHDAELPKIELKDAFYAIGQCYYDLGDVYSCLEKYSQASDSYKKAFEMDPEQVDCLYEIGNALWNDEKPDESKKYVLEFIEKKSTYQAHYLLGLIYARENSVLAALKEFWICVENKQDDSNSDHYRARAYHCLGNARLTEKYFKRSILRDPENVGLMYALITHYETNGEGKKAYQYYEIIKAKKKTLDLMKKTM